MRRNREAGGVAIAQLGAQVVLGNSRNLVVTPLRVAVEVEVVVGVGQPAGDLLGIELREPGAQSQLDALVNGLVGVEHGALAAIA